MDAAISESELREQDSLLDLLAQANHLVNEILHQHLKGQGISATEWRILAALAAADGAPMTELAERVRLKQPTLTKAVDRMSRAQLVERRTPSEDRRRTLVLLTERGRRIAAPLVARARQHEARVTRALGEAEGRELCAALRRLIDRVEASPQGLRGAD